MQQNEGSKYPYYFLALYALTYMCNAIYGTFISVYLDHIGFSKSIIGTLLALGPFVAIIAQPVWGLASDRAKTKNHILKLMLLGTALTIILYPVSTNFYYIFAAMAVFTFFQTSINPVSDAITLEHLEATRWKYGPIRLTGTIGYALMSVLVGIIVKQNINNIFPLYFAIALSAFLVSFRLPTVKGHQSGGKRIPIWTIFKNRQLVVLMTLNLIVQITLGFYYSFFPIYYKQMGASSVMIGMSMFVSSICEIPFLLFSSRILQKIGVKFTLILSTAIMGIRWMLLHVVTNVYPVLLINALHGLSFIVFAYCFAIYINKEVPKELRASGQTMNGLIGMGIARIIGSILGGFLSDMFGIRPLFFYTSLLNFAAVAVFGAIFVMESINKRKNGEISA